MVIVVRGDTTIAILMFGYHGGMMGYGGMFFGLIFWIIIIVGAYLLIKFLIEQNKARKGEEKSALDIAKGRYAKGEITAEEFEEIKRRLV